MTLKACLAWPRSFLQGHGVVALGFLLASAKENKKQGFFLPGFLQSSRNVLSMAKSWCYVYRNLFLCTDSYFFWCIFPQLLIWFIRREVLAPLSTQNILLSFNLTLVKLFNQAWVWTFWKKTQAGKTHGKRGKIRSQNFHIFFIVFETKKMSITYPLTISQID